MSEGGDGMKALHVGADGSTVEGGLGVVKARQFCLLLTGTTIQYEPDGEQIVLLIYKITGCFYFPIFV